MTAPVDHPFASASGQFPLGPPEDAPPSTEQPSPIGLRPWGLRGLTSAASPSASRFSGVTLCPERQVAVDSDGRALKELPNVMAGPPTADTTATVDGEDPPSSEDWKNDYYPDDSPLP